MNVSDLSPNMLVPYYLMSSYLYYEEDTSVISDAEFDEVCARLDAVWDDVDHFHKDLIHRDALASGTGYYLTYPARVKGAALHWLAQSSVKRRVTNPVTNPGQS